MKKTCKFCWALSALLIVGIAAMAYMFVIRGNVTASDDGRTSILLSAGERDLVLTEMRGFLEAVEVITVAISEKDMVAVASSAHDVGMANARGVPASLMGKLPLDFKSLGSATHKAFDALAVEAQDMGDEQLVLSKLGNLMSNCTTCHAAFRFDIEDEK
ncbi:MAG: cytochrome c [Rhodospirillales bacterium]|nr:cytochrome c [Rhodospirillales bacterium]